MEVIKRGYPKPLIADPNGKNCYILLETAPLESLVDNFLMNLGPVWLEEFRSFVLKNPAFKFK